MKGQCLCGAVTLSAPDHHQVSICHCGMCRRWGGGPLFAIECEHGVTITGEQHIAIYRSSDWAQRAFCQHCGTHLYYQFLGNSLMAIPAGLFQDVEHFALSSQIFIDKKPDYYAFANHTAMLTEQQVFDLYSN